MNRLIPVLLALVTLSTPAIAQTPVDTCGDPRATGHCPDWTKVFGGTTVARDVAADAALAPDGKTVVVTGRRITPSRDYVTVAFDAETGRRLWHATFDGNAHMKDAANAVAISPDGDTAYVTGTSQTGHPDRAVVGDNYLARSEPLTIAYDLDTGQERWRSAGIGAEGAGAGANELVVSPDGSRVFITGRSAERAQHSWIFYTVALDAATGSSVWERAHAGTGLGAEAFDLALSPDGTNLVVVGDAYMARDVRPPDPESRPEVRVPADVDQDVVAIAYDAQNGTPRWLKTWDGGAVFHDFARAVAIAPNGTVYVGGSVEAAPMDDFREFMVMALDGDGGSEYWARMIDLPGQTHEWVSDLAVSPDGNRVIATGSSSNSGDQSPDVDHVTFALRTDTGAERWRHVRRAGFDEGEPFDRLAVLPEGGTVVQTHTAESPNGGSDLVATALDISSGGARWQRRFDGGADSNAALVANEHGIVMAGTSVTSTGRQFVAAGLGRGGEQRWSAGSALEAPAPDEPIDSAVSSDGSALFVAGVSEIGENYVAGRMHTSFTIAGIDAATGATTWQRPSQSGRTDAVNAITLSADDRVLYVTGSSHVHESDVAGPLTMALDAATGETLWTSRRHGGGEDLAVSPDGERLYLLGGGCSLAAYDARSGGFLWEASYAGPNGESQACRALTVSANGRWVGMTGHSNQGDLELLATVVDAETGQRLWRRTYNASSGSHETGMFLGFTPNGTRLLVAGETRNGSVGDVVTIAFDASNGAASWIQVWDGGAGLTDQATGLHVTMDGIFTTAAVLTNADTTKLDFGVAKYALGRGENHWTATYDDMFQSEVARDSALSPDGSQIVVSGYSPGLQATRYLAVAFDTTFGEKQWAALYEEAGAQGRYHTLSVAGGRAFILGAFESGSQDFGVLAYPLATET